MSSTVAVQNQIELETRVSTIEHCLHCDTPIGLARAKINDRFCCEGCQFVYSLLNENSLTDYYQIRTMNPEVCPRPVQPTKENFAYCDDPEVLQVAAKDGVLKFYLEGLQCSACFWLLENLASLSDEIAESRINMAESTIEIRKTENGRFSQAARLLDQLGYRPHLVSSKQQTETLKKKEDKRQLVRIGIVGCLTGNIMLLSVSLYAGLSGQLAFVFEWLMGALAFPVLSYGAWPLYKNTFSSFKSRRLALDVPIVFALWAGFLLSFISLIGSRQQLYFDSLSMLVFLLLSSRFWQRRIQAHYLDTSDLHEHLLLSTVTKHDQMSGSSQQISSLSLIPGDLVTFEPDQIVPCDGIVDSGEARINAAALTGEVHPLHLRAGDRVEAGMRALNSGWRLKVTANGKQTRMSQILEQIEAGNRSQPALPAFADRIGQAFTWIVLSCAAMLLFAISDKADAATRALTLVIVTCPCVFGMAIPLSLSLAIKKAARLGIFVKDASVFERLLNVRKVYFDKTGTLTEGMLQVQSMQNIGALPEDLDVALALEHEEAHPVARAIKRFLLTHGRKPMDLTSPIETLKSGGRKAIAHQNMYEIRPERADEGSDLTSCSAAMFLASNEAQRGSIRTQIGLYKNDALIATFTLQDQLKIEARILNQDLQSRGIASHVISGDQKAAVLECTKQLGLPSQNGTSNMTPEEKANRILSEPFPAMMVGDGINDASALSSAYVGVAVCGSMEISLRAADVYLLQPDLRLISQLMDLARQTQRTIRRNLTFSAMFNVIAAIAAILGFMQPLWAAVIMPLSSFTVLASAILGARK